MDSPSQGVPPRPSILALQWKRLSSSVGRAATPWEGRGGEGRGGEGRGGEGSGEEGRGGEGRGGEGRGEGRTLSR